MNIYGKINTLMFLLLLILWCGNTQAIAGINASKAVMFSDTTRYWHVDPSKYEFSMTIIGMISSDGFNGTEMEHELGAFHNGELRGSARACYISNNNTYVFFLTVFGNDLGDSIQFSLYNHSSTEILPMDELIDFKPDTHSGEILSPYPFTLSTTNTVEISSSSKLKLYPNPFTHQLNAELNHPLKRLIIYDSEGRLIKTYIPEFSEYKYLNLDLSLLLPGTYFIRVIGDEYSYTTRVVKN